MTEADYAAVADRFDEVQRAAGRLRWTGSWYTAFVTVDRVGGGSPTTTTSAPELRDFLDTYRMAGIDVEVDAPVPVPLEVALDVCVAARPRRRRGRAPGRGGVVGPGRCPTAAAGSSIPTTSPSASRCT